jgi:peptide/nickel transport system substrate-binding protein
MKKISSILLALAVSLSILVAYCTPAPAQTQKKSLAQEAASASQPTTAPSSAGLKAQKGGVLRGIRSTFPKVLGYPPEMSPVDSIFVLPVVERLVDWDANGNLIPQLAESWEGDAQHKTVTWHLRKGVRFHDGTAFNAEALKWNFQVGLESGRLTDGQFVKSIDVLDDQTVRMNLTEYTSLAFENYGWQLVLSPTAFKANGGKEWARTHAVGTGPFKLIDFKRDTLIRYEKNSDYWRKDYPLLDAVEIRFVPDPMTAAMSIESKEADIWLDVSNVRQVLDLQQKGLKVNWGPGMFWFIMPNSKDPKSPFANKKVREAIEYALDRPAMAKSLGFGKFEASTQIVPSASPAYVPGYNPRPYGPERARQLLADAGYPNGFETSLLTYDTSASRDIGTALQSYLAAVGIQLKVDVADAGRYYGSVYGPQGFSDLALVQSGINPDGTDVFVHFGPRPMTYRFGNPAKSPEYLSLCEKALKTYDLTAWKKVLNQVVLQGGEDAMIIPIFRSAQAVVMQPFVHSDYMKIHTITWNSYRDWIEKKK